MPLMPSLLGGIFRYSCPLNFHRKLSLSGFEKFWWFWNWIGGYILEGLYLVLLDDLEAGILKDISKTNPSSAFIKFHVKFAYLKFLLLWQYIVTIYRLAVNLTKLFSSDQH